MNSAKAMSSETAGTSAPAGAAGLFSNHRRLLVLLAIALALLTAFLYAPAMRNGFVNFDDPDYVTRNAHVLQGINGPNMIWALGTDNPAGNWHPLTWMSHMLDVTWYGTNPAGHHFTNVFLFVLDVVILFLLLESATGRVLRSAAVAALFALHPLNVETVAWVAERKSVLCLLFLFLSMWAYVWYTQKPGVGRYVLVALLFALALAAKIMVITLPFLLLLLDYWPLERLAERPSPNAPVAFFARLGKLLMEKIPLFLLAAGGGAMTLFMHHKEGTLTTAMPLAWRFRNAVYSYVVYLGKIVWPARLAVFYPHPENTLSPVKAAVAGLALAVITGIVWRLRKERYLTVGWLWYLGALAPMIGFIQSGRQGMADRYACISLIGLFLAVVWILADLAVRLRVSPGLVAASTVLLMAPYAYVTRVQIGYWHDSYTLFTEALRVTSNNGMAENNLGVALMEMGQAPLALPHFEAAVRLVPTLASAHYNLAVLLQRQNQLEDAVRQYQKTIELSSDRMEAAQAHNNLGALYLQTRNFAAAVPEFNEAIALNPSEQNSYIGRAMIELQSWNYDAAIADFSHAAGMAPSPLALYWLGRTFENKGDQRRAAGAYQAALQLAPGMADARARLQILQAPAGGRP